MGKTRPRGSRNLCLEFYDRVKRKNSSVIGHCLQFAMFTRQMARVPFIVYANKILYNSVLCMFNV